MYHKPISCKMSSSDIKAISKEQEFSESKVKKIINNLLREVHILIIKDMSKFILYKVPKMTGRLRRDLLSHLKDSHVKNQILRIYIQTSIEYAERVNAFQTHNVRHSGKKIKYRGRVIILWDPYAIGHFFDKMVIFAMKSLIVNLKIVKKKYATRKGLRKHQLDKIKIL